MRHYIPKKSNPKSSFVQAILFLVVFIVGVIGYQIIKKRAFTDSMGSLFTSDIESFRALKTMKEEEKEKLKKQFAGFWVNKTENSDSLPIQKYDCLEIKDNGIIWEVISWRVSYPGRDSFYYYYHIKHAYFNPYDTGADGKTFVCEVRTIR
ncbi:MAG: hypothetical protein N2053_09090, partial [Chitinispirillaceae bacterium]|nr:hypothetical protein [Chitinispirillaceae bacterium]